MHIHFSTAGAISAEGNDWSIGILHRQSNPVIKLSSVADLEKALYYTFPPLELYCLSDDAIAQIDPQNRILIPCSFPC